MEPGFNTPRVNPERAPSLPPVSPELVSPDIHQEARVEREPLLQSVSDASASVVAAPVLPQPVAVDADGQGSVATLLSSIPDVAADDDLIEKEWIDRAKHIITETVDDPYAREQAVSQLQREYLRKRYGKEVGVSE